MARHWRRVNHHMHMQMNRRLDPSRPRAQCYSTRERKPCGPSDKKSSATSFLIELLSSDFGQRRNLWMRSLKNLSAVLWSPRNIFSVGIFFFWAGDKKVATHFSRNSRERPLYLNRSLYSCRTPSNCECILCYVQNLNTFMSVFISTNR